MYGGAVLNATISLYAHATLEPINENKIILSSSGSNGEQVFDWTDELPLTGELDLAKGVFNRIRKDHKLSRKGFRLSTYVDAPFGSGLGISSTLVVSVIGVFAEMLGLQLGEYEIAHYAYDIERKDLNLAGGKQDQYAATFGGVNFMEFREHDIVVVNPLQIKREYLFELENNLLLYYTDTTRDSGKIIEQQVKNVIDKKEESVNAMHQLKQQAIMMKEALLEGRLNEIGEILDFGFQQKRKMAEGISIPLMEDIYEAAKAAGASGGKISGAGGGGFMIFYCPGNSKYAVMKSLEKFGGKTREYEFVEHGLRTWAG